MGFFEIGRIASRALTWKGSLNRVSGRLGTPDVDQQTRIGSARRGKASERLQEFNQIRPLCTSEIQPMTRPQSLILRVTSDTRRALAAAPQ